MTPPQPLTHRQRAVYDWLAARIAAAGVAPSIREVMDAFRFKSPNTVAGYYRALERKGWVVRGAKGHARSLRLVADPAGDLHRELRAVLGDYLALVPPGSATAGRVAGLRDRLAAGCGGGIEDGR